MTRVPFITNADAPPPGPTAGDLWWSTVKGQLFVWYDDGSTTQWVVANQDGQGPVGPVGPTGPAGPIGPAGPTGPQGPASADNAINVKSFGAICNGTTDDTAALNTALASVIASGSELYLPGVCRCLGDVPQIHQAKVVGPGGILMTSARTWRAEPSTRTAFSQRQTLYVNPTGSDTNSGLGPSFPLKTMPGVVAVLQKYGYLAGNWSVTLAAGEYTDKVQFIGISNSGSVTLYIEGPVPPGAWNNTTPPATADTTGGSVPTAIFRPTLPNRGVAGYGTALDFQRNIGAKVMNIQFRDWGNNTYTGNDGAVKAGNMSRLYTENLHIWDCNMGITGRDLSMLTVESGLIHGCRSGVFTVGGVRYTLGYGQSAAGQPGATLIRQCVFGVDLWEDTTGHVDYVVLEDNGAHVYARRKSHASINGVTFRNTGGFGISKGVVMAENSVVGMNTDFVWTGSHVRRVEKNSGAQDTRLANITMATELAAWATPNLTTSGTTALSLASVALPAEEFTYYPQQVSIRVAALLNNLLATASLTVRANGSFMTQINIPLVAATRIAEYEIFINPTDAANQTIEGTELSGTSAGTVYRVIRTSGVTAVNFAIAQTLAVSMVCGNVADAITVLKCEIFRRG